MPRARNGKPTAAVKKKSAGKAKAGTGRAKEPAKKNAGAGAKGGLAMPAKKTADLPIARRVRAMTRITAGRTTTPQVAWGVLAKREGMSVRTAQRLFGDRVEILEALSDSRIILDASLVTFQLSQDEFSEIVADPETPPHVKVGALRGVIQTEILKMQVLAREGTLPESWEDAKDQREFEEIQAKIQQWLAVAAKTLPKPVVDTLVATIQGSPAAETLKALSPEIREILAAHEAAELAAGSG